MIAETGIWALVPAAGAGTRMQAALPKQYLALLGRPIILHTLERLCTYPRLRGVRVGIAARDRHWPALANDTGRLPNFLGSFTGGETRAATVLNGLYEFAAHAKPRDWILVHDAVRPCLRHRDLDRLLDTVGDYPDGGLLALPMSDTVKRTDDQGRVLQTVARADLWRALTPQMFRLDMLTSALERVLKQGSAVTDEAMAVEQFGARPRVVAGSADNIKITLPDDLALAGLLLKRQQEQRA